MVVYLIKNTINGKVYVGQTIQPLEVRIRRHFWNAKQGQAGALYNAIRKYGAESFTNLLLEAVETQDALNQAEAKWVTYFDSVSPSGYNLIGGGYAKGKHSAELIQKLSDAHKGYKVKDSTKAKISASSKDRYFSPEHRAKISAAKTGKKNERLSRTLRARGGNNSKLSWEDVRQIRMRYATGTHRQHELCRDYRVSAASICMILSGKTWVEI